jgi:hypothetical protein
MATTFAATVKVSIDGQYIKTDDLGAARQTLGVAIADVFASGVGNLQADLYAEVQRTVTNPTTDTIDLTSTLTDIYGVTFNVATLKGLIVHHTGTVGNLTLSGTALANAGMLGASGQNIVKPGGWWAQLAPNEGYTITNGTQDLIDVDSSVGAIVYDIHLIGTSS